MGLRPMREILRKKRNGQRLTSAELHHFVAGVTDQSVSDEQVGAMLMAIFLNGLVPSETVELTRAMLDSGDQLDWGTDHPRVVDKHSTGGVGDKISLPLAPALAANGLLVPMISGRGLGHTGGTLDKLESIPGYRVRLASDEIHSVVKQVGCVICGQTDRIAPADRRLYSIRDVTETVDSIPLITGSILSKKAAAGLSALILDVKVGRGAFMTDQEAGQELAESLVQVGKGLGMRTSAILTEMDHPIGRTIGNSLEIHETIECLKGAGNPDLVDLVAALGGELLALTGGASDCESGADAIRRTLTDGTALDRFRQMVEAVGGNPHVIDSPDDLLPSSPLSSVIECPDDGYLSSIDSLDLAWIALDLGAGRKQKTDTVDPAVGIEVLSPRGASIQRGQPLFRVHHRHEIDDSLRERLLDTVVVSPEKIAATSRIITTIR